MNKKLAPLLALVLLLAIAIGTIEFYNQTIAEQLPTRAVTLLSLATMLLGGWLVGIIFHQLGLPKICGYILFGIAIGPAPYMLNILPSKQHVSQDLSFINYLAISLIALTAGGEIQLDWLRKRFKQISALVVVEVTLVIFGSLICFLFAAPFLPFLSNSSNTVTIVCAVFFAVIVITKSPMVTIAIISDYRSKGPLTQTVLSLVVATDVLLVALFATAVITAKSVLDPAASISTDFIFAVILQLVGSIAAGVVAGVLMALYVQRLHAHLGVFVVACCMLFALLGDQSLYIGQTGAHLEPLLMAMTAGFVMENIYPDSATALFHRVKQLNVPVYCLFFTLAGAKIDLILLWDLFYFAIGFALVRAFLLWGSLKCALRVSGINEPWAVNIWRGMISQAGVSIVLVTIILAKFGEYSWAVSLSNLLIGMIVCNELVGPILFRNALIKSGEVQK